MFATKALRQAAQHAERTPMIKFIGKRSIPCEFSFLAKRRSSLPPSPGPSGVHLSQTLLAPKHGFSKFKQS